MANAGKVLRYLHESCRKVIIAFDSDNAGEAAFSVLFDILRTSGIQTSRLRIEKGKDANEWLCSDPKGFYEAVTRENA